VVALSTLPSGYVVKFTDNAWTGTALNTNEGTLQFTTSAIVAAGSMWSYDGATMTNPFGTWTKLQVSLLFFSLFLWLNTAQGSFSLATTGDSILVYSGDSSSPYFIFGLSIIPWATPGATIDTNNCFLPTALTNAGVSASIYFNDIDNALYNGTVTGTKSQLQNWICNSANWLTSDSTLYSPTQLRAFTVLPSSSSPTASPSAVPSLVATSWLPTLSPSVSSLIVSKRTLECYSNCSYSGMSVPPGQWGLLEYCEFYQSTSCTMSTVSSCSCVPICLSDCVDVFCDSMSSLALICGSSVDQGAVYPNTSSTQSSCLDAFAATSPTQTLMTFLAVLVFKNVNVFEMSTLESQDVAIVGMEMSVSGVTANDITIERVADGDAAATTLLSVAGPLRSSLSAQTASNVTYKFSVVLESLGYDSLSSSSAYLQLTEAITSAVADGRLEHNLRAVGAKAASSTFSSVSISSPPKYSTAVVTPKTDSSSPSSSPSSDHSKDSSGANDDESPRPLHLALYIIGGIIGVSLLALGGLMALNRRRRTAKEQSYEIETRTTFSENPMKKSEGTGEQ
jgi:hypothetical protein